jgi:hypothetical protein
MNWLVSYHPGDPSPLDARLLKDFSVGGTSRESLGGLSVSGEAARAVEAVLNRSKLTTMSAVYLRNLPVISSLAPNQEGAPLHLRSAPDEKKANFPEAGAIGVARSMRIFGNLAALAHCGL